MLESWVVGGSFIAEPVGPVIVPYVSWPCCSCLSEFASYTVTARQRLKRRKRLCPDDLALQTTLWLVVPAASGGRHTVSGGFALAIGALAPGPSLLLLQLLLADILMLESTVLLSKSRCFLHAETALPVQTLRQACCSRCSQTPAPVAEPSGTHLYHRQLAFEHVLSVFYLSDAG